MPPHPPPKPTAKDLAALLTDVATGRLSVADAMANLSVPQPTVAQPLPTPAAESGAANASDAATSQRVTLDLDRQRRCGFPEVIYGEGKPAEMIAEIIRAQHAAEQSSFVTRIPQSVAEKVQTLVSNARFNPLAKTLSVGIAGANPPAPLIESQPTSEHVAVVTAGSTDAPVAEEAIETLHWMGIYYRSFDDIGVAGPARLLSAVPKLREASAVVVIAGMEGALPAAVGGHLSVPVFAVPTSVGYGATLGGLTPMLGMLSSCASNVAVVNIDAGFKAAYLAGLVTRLITSST